jgi:hypothetical protein
VVSLLGVGLDLGISGVLSFQQHQIQVEQDQNNKQNASNVCWDDVLTTAIRDHLSPAQRSALTVRANHCADITEPNRTP